MDINVDTGEGFNNEAKLIPLVSSCNIACGGHAGDVDSIRKVVLLAKKNKVRIGAHPSYMDPDNFGRIALSVDIDQLFKDVFLQVFTVVNVAKDCGANVDYIKPHGALYHQVCNNFEFADKMLDLISKNFPELKLMGLPNCISERLALERGVGYIREGFADRVYEKDGNLRKRNLENSVFTNKEDLLNQFVKISKKQPVITATGEELVLDVDSICFHGDHDGAIDNLKFVVDSIQEYNLKIGV